MREALELIRARNPDFDVDGEMQADTALSHTILANAMPDSPLARDANLLIMPCLDAANIAFNLTKVVSGAVVLGPMLLGADKAVHIVTPSITVRGLLNMSAIAMVDSLRIG